MQEVGAYLEDSHQCFDAALMFWDAQGLCPKVVLIPETQKEPGPIGVCETNAVISVFIAYQTCAGGALLRKLWLFAQWGRCKIASLPDMFRRHRGEAGPLNCCASRLQEASFMSLPWTHSGKREGTRLEQKWQGVGSSLQEIK